MKPRELRLRLCLISLSGAIVCSCSNPEADFYSEAESHFANEHYEDAISALTEALTATNGGEWSAWGSGILLRGDIWLLRARAYEVTGQLDEALLDYDAAIGRGYEYSASYALNSDPAPGAKADWFRTFSRYFNSLGLLYAKTGQYEDALEAFSSAVAVASGSVNRVDTVDQVVGALLGSEGSKRQEFSTVIGAYLLNIGLMERQLGRSSDAMRLANELGYDSTLIATIE